MLARFPRTNLGLTKIDNTVNNIVEGFVRDVDL